MKIENYKIKNLNKNIFIVVLFLIAFLERTLFDLGPNIELVTAAMILSAYYIGAKQSAWLTLSIMVLSDLILGNSSIFIFTWSGFLIPAMLSGALIRKLAGLKLFKKVTGLVTYGLSANLFFFFWTNFGVWFLSDMYTKNPDGLLMSYINGLPFLRYQLFSTLVFVPLGFALTEFALYAVKRLQLQRRLDFFTQIIS